MIHAKRLSVLLLCTALVLPAIGCTSDGESDEGNGSQDYTVTRGSLTVDVTASGNLAFSTEEELAFDMAGTVEDVFVEEGDAVTEDQVVATLDTSDWEERLRSLQLSVLSSETSLKQAEMALEAAEEETLTTITGDVVVNCCPDDDEIEIKEMQVEQAELRLADARVKLDEHLAQSPEVVAPFDGFVTMVAAEGGDEVFKGSIAVTIVDPNEFEALILVGENDIAQVTEGIPAEVSVDSMSGVVLPAEVTAVAPTATISSGVVNYQVTVKVASKEEIATYIEEQMAAARAEMEKAREQAASGEMPDKLKDAIEAGEISEEEAKAMMEKAQSGPSQNAPAPASVEDIGLREGLSVSVTLLIAQKSDVLLVPNAAIDVEGNRAFVTVLTDSGDEEQRAITTGSADWQFTEVTGGLEEGEVIRTFSAMSAGYEEEEQGGFAMGPGGHPRG